MQRNVSIHFEVLPEMPNMQFTSSCEARAPSKPSKGLTESVSRRVYSLYGQQYASAQYPVDSMAGHTSSQGDQSAYSHRKPSRATSLNPESAEFMPTFLPSTIDYGSTSPSAYMGSSSSNLDSGSYTTEPSEQDPTTQAQPPTTLPPVNDGPLPLEQLAPPNYHDLTPTDLAVYLQDDLSPPHIPNLRPPPPPPGLKIHSVRVTTFLFNSSNKVLVLSVNYKRHKWELPSRRIIFPQTEAEHAVLTSNGKDRTGRGKLDQRSQSVEEIGRHLVKNALENSPDCELAGKEAEEGMLYFVRKESIPPDGQYVGGPVPPHMRAAGGKKAFDEIRYKMDPQKKWDEERKKNLVPVLSVNVAIILRGDPDLSELRTNRHGEFTLDDSGRYYDNFRWCGLDESEALLKGEWKNAGMVRSAFERHASERARKSARRTEED